jgi:hypothetical protein
VRATAGIAFCFGKLHVGGKLSLLHKLAYTLRTSLHGMT